jgi:hypothetical protein
MKKQSYVNGVGVWLPLGGGQSLNFATGKD